MTPQEKYAEDLIKQYLDLDINVKGDSVFDSKKLTNKSAVKCALIDLGNSVYELLNTDIPSQNRYNFLMDVKQILESKLK